MTAAGGASGRYASEARGIALLRVALVPIALLGVSAHEPSLTGAAYPWVMAGFAVYALVMLAVAWRVPGGRRLSTAVALMDLVALSVVIYASGGPRSPVKYTFYVLPVAAALRLSPALTAAWSGLAVLAYLAVALPHPDTTLPGDWDVLLSDSLSLAWVGGAAVMLSALVGRRQRELAQLAATRRALVQQALDAEAHERRRLAEELHDHAIQNVLLARQEVTDVARGRPGAAERLRAALDATDRQLRREVFEMHPLGLERAGLAAVLHDLADHAAQRGGFAADVVVEPDAERSGTPELLVSAARELLTNAAKHARAAHVHVTVRPVDGGGTELTVADDGVGIPDGRLESAVAEHHIGVASLVERVRAADGEVRIDGRPGGGTTVTVRLPASQQRP
jgi:two-component system NarL family sensor kinase